jgi:flagella basal body P-ring formation protein FlgA
MRSFANAFVVLMALAVAAQAQHVGVAPVDSAPVAAAPAATPVTDRTGPALPRAGRVASTAPADNASPTIPPALSRQVAAAIAHQWGDDSASLQLVWSRVPHAAAFPPSTDVHVVGRGDGGWFVAVFTPGSAGPFAIRVRAGGADSAIVATRTIEAGRTLAVDDLRVVSRTRWGPPGDASSPRVAAGWVTKHVVMAGTDVTDASATPPPLVHAGDPVRLEWRRGAVLITLDGTAIDAGGAGQTVRVHVGQNRGAKSGTVLATGIVRLDS